MSHQDLPSQQGDLYLILIKSLSEDQKDLIRLMVTCQNSFSPY